MRSERKVYVKCLAPCRTGHGSIQQNDSSQVEDEGDEEGEDFDVSDVGAKPGNSQVSALTTHFQKRQTSPCKFPFTPATWMEMLSVSPDCFSFAKAVLSHNNKDQAIWSERT